MERKSLIVILCMIVIFLPVVTATCYCEMENALYIQGETVTVGCYCDDPPQTNDAYTITWYNSTGSAKEIDTGTTPNLVNTYFYEDYIISVSETDFGVWNVTLELTSIEDYVEFNVSNSSTPNTDTLYFLEAEYSQTIDLGTIAGGTARLYNPSWGYVNNAYCVVGIHSPQNIPIDAFTGVTDGDGHLQGYTDTIDWNRAAGNAGELEGLSITWHVSCTCFADCTTSQSGQGCCVSDNSTLVTDYLVGEEEFLSTIGDDLTPLGDYQLLSLTLLTLFYLSIIFFLGNTWRVSLFTREREPISLIQVLFTWLGLFLNVWLVQFMLRFLEDGYANNNVINLYETLYSVSYWILYTVSAFIIVFFIYNLLLYLGIDIIKPFRRGGK